MIFAIIWLTYLLIGTLVVSFKEGLSPYDEAVSKIVIWPFYLYVMRGPKPKDELKHNPLDY